MPGGCWGRGLYSDAVLWLQYRLGKMCSGPTSTRPCLCCSSEGSEQTFKKYQAFSCPSLRHHSLLKWFWESHWAGEQGKGCLISAPFDISALVKNVEFKISMGRVLISGLCPFLPLCGGGHGSNWPRFMTNAVSPGVWPQPSFLACLDLCRRYHHLLFQALLWIRDTLLSNNNTISPCIWCHIFWSCLR